MLLDETHTLSVVAVFSIRSHFARPGGAGKRKARKTKSAEVGTLVLLIMQEVYLLHIVCKYVHVYICADTIHVCTYVCT